MKYPSTRRQTLSIFLVLLVVVGVGFFVPISRDSWVGVVGKGILYLFIFVALYVMFFMFGSQAQPRSIKPSYQEDSEFLGGIEDRTEDGDWHGFGNAFQNYARDLVSVVRSAIVASSVGIYLKKGNDVLEFHVGETSEGLVDRSTTVDETNIVHQVLRQSKPILESNLPIGSGMGGLPGIEMRSFLGVPLSWEQGVVGVLAVSGETTECFGEEDRDFLCRCGDLLIRVMSLCHQGIRWEMDQAVYQTHISMEKSLERSRDEESAVYGFIQHLKRLFPFDRMSLCIRDEDEGIVRHVYGQGDMKDQGLRFSLNEGLNGWVLKRNTPLLVDDMEEGNYIRPRYSRDEDPKHGLRSFMGIPLGSGQGAWGCLSIESRSVNQYTVKERDVLLTLSIPFQITLERFHLRQRLKEPQQEPPREE